MTPDETMKAYHKSNPYKALWDFPITRAHLQDAEKRRRQHRFDEMGQRLWKLDETGLGGEELKETIE